MASWFRGDGYTYLSAPSLTRFFLDFAHYETGIEQVGLRDRMGNVTLVYATADSSDAGANSLFVRKCT